MQDVFAKMPRLALRGVYVLNPLRQSNPDSTHAHQALPFLRANPVNATVIVMKNKDLRPVMVKARDMSGGGTFNNIVEASVNCLAVCNMYPFALLA